MARTKDTSPIDDSHVGLPIEETLVPDLVIVDADSLIYKACWKNKSPLFAAKALDDAVAKIISDLNVSEAFVFIKGSDNFRFKIDFNYKGHRSGNMDDDMRERVNKLYEHCQNTYATCDGAEADDYCAIYNKKMIEEGRVPIVSHIDKDLNMIPGLHHHYGKNGIYTVYPNDAHTFLMLQLITGDAADGIKGNYGIGPTKAIDALEGCTNARMFDRVLEVWEKNTAKLLSDPAKLEKKGIIVDPDWKAAFCKAANLLYIRDNENDFRELSFEEIEDRMRWVGDGPAFSRVHGLNLFMLNKQETNVHEPT